MYQKYQGVKICLKKRKIVSVVSVILAHVKNVNVVNVIHVLVKKIVHVKRKMILRKNLAVVAVKN